MKNSTYIYQRVPPLPEITVGNDTDRVTQLRLNARRHRDHQIDQFTFDRNYLILGKLVISIFICPIPLDEVLEAQCAGQAGGVGVIGRRRDL